jgi:hypothetical protein
MTRRVPVLLLVVGLLLTFVTLAVGGLAGEVPPCATGTIIELEVARTESAAVELIGACDEAGLDVLRDGLRIDTLGFVPLYVASTASWCLLGARRLRWSSAGRRRLVLAAVPAVVVAAGFDLVENHHLGTVVDAAGASDAIGAAFAASVAKWVLVLYAVPVSAVALVRSVRGGGRAAGRADSARAEHGGPPRLVS